jgi:hypothetical protein
MHAAIASVMRGLKREKGTRADVKAALTTDQVRSRCAACRNRRAACATERYC